MQLRIGDLNRLVDSVHAMNRSVQATRLVSVFHCNRLFIHKPLSFGQLHRYRRAFAIIHLASVPQKVELPQVAVQVFLAHAVVDSHDAALQKSKGTFRRIRVDVAANVFLCAVSNRVVTACEVRTDADVGSEIVREDARLIVHHFTDSTFQRLAGRVGE